MSEELTPPEDWNAGGPSHRSPEAESGHPRSESGAWKEVMRQRFEAWLATVDAHSEAASFPDDDADTLEEPPDLESFLKELIAVKGELRTGNRRTIEALRQWQEALPELRNELSQLGGKVAALESSDPSPARGTDRSLALQLIEMADRLARIRGAFAAPPRVPWRLFGMAKQLTAPWEKAWRQQHQGLKIVGEHFDHLLEQMGIGRFKTVDEPFDPSCMMALDTETAPGKPPRTVVREIVAGYRHHGELLRPAQVIVSTPSSPE